MREESISGNTPEHITRVTGTRRAGGSVLLSATDYSVSAGGVTLFHDLGFNLDPGEMVALCGPSGSGKTTLLRAVAGLIDPSSGEILLNGVSIGEIGWPEFRRKVILVDQRPVLLAGTVEENLRLPFTYRTAGGREFPGGEAVALLETFGVSAGRFSQEARSLSQGQQQRVCLARAFLLKPDVLLLDEPTSALDPEAVSSVERILALETRRRGLSALVVTHDLEQAARLCDRIINLTDYGARADVS